jgi:hypothetical protein
MTKLLNNSDALLNAVALIGTITFIPFFIAAIIVVH